MDPFSFVEFCRAKEDRVGPLNRADNVGAGVDVFDFIRLSEPPIGTIVLLVLPFVPLLRLVVLMLGPSPPECREPSLLRLLKVPLLARV